MNIAQSLSAEFSVLPWQAESLISLVDEGNTIPFIARYRKERHGSMDDQTLRRMAERLIALRGLEKRRGEIEASLREQGVEDKGLYAALAVAVTQSEMEDLYRPYRPKRRTRASIAREKGLEPLADRMMDAAFAGSVDEEARALLNPEKGVSNLEEALAGARDIIAERISDDAELRGRLRRVVAAQGRILCKAARDEDSVYRMYYDYGESLAAMAPHRVLAMNRGEAEGYLKVSLTAPDEAGGLAIAAYAHGGAGGAHTRVAAADAYDRLILPSLERELRAALTETASEAALRVFAVNLRNLLMTPPLKGKTVLALDPGIRTGCKIAIVDAASRVLDTGVIFPLPAHGKVPAARRAVLDWIERYRVSVIAIGNGTASRETQAFVAETLSGMRHPPGYAIVDEAGASVYSASERAAREFPGMDVSLRGAVSLARRIQDPMAELVKIDPKSIGVGQYQHDMKPARLDETLGGVVEDAVNAVGVDANTASAALLSYVAGIGPALADSIVSYREEHGPFATRAEFRKVKKLGPKAFEQCAGFMRIHEGKRWMDATAVHPESYEAAEALLHAVGLRPGADLSSLASAVGAYPADRLCAELSIGRPTLDDIVAELQKPGRDPRDDLPPILLRTDVLTLEDLKAGMEVAGTVRNVVDFGAFVDIGVHRDGLVHISHMAQQRIAHPSQLLKVGDIVKVYVLEVDAARQRISLSLLPVR